MVPNRATHHMSQTFTPCANRDNLMIRPWKEMQTFCSFYFNYAMQENCCMGCMSMESGPNCYQIGNKTSYIPKVSKFSEEKWYLC